MNSEQSILARVLRKGSAFEETRQGTRSPLRDAANRRCKSGCASAALDPKRGADFVGVRGLDRPGGASRRAKNLERSLLNVDVDINRETIVATSSKGMVQVAGTTYRVVESPRVHRVIRVLDDRVVGTFRYGSGIEVVSCEVSPELLLRIGKHSLQSARLSWPPSATATRPSRLAGWADSLVLSWHRTLASMNRLMTVLLRPRYIPVLARSHRLHSALPPTQGTGPFAL